MKRFKKILPPRQLEGRIRTIVERLGNCECPLSEDTAEWVARRIGKGLPRRSREVLSYEIGVHLTEGNLSVREELDAAILNWKMAVLGR